MLTGLLFELHWDCTFFDPLLLQRLNFESKFEACRPRAADMEVLVASFALHARAVGRVMADRTVLTT